MLVTNAIAKCNLTAGVIYLDVLQIVFLLVLADWLICAFIGLDAGLEVLQRLHGVLVFVIRARELETHVRFQELKSPMLTNKSFL